MVFDVNQKYSFTQLGFEMPHRKLQPNWVDVVVGANARNLRLKAQMDLVQVADKIGVSVDMLASCESGSSRFQAMHLYRLSRLLDVRVDAFFCDADVHYGRKTKPDHLRLV